LRKQGLVEFGLLESGGCGNKNMSSEHNVILSTSSYN